MEKGKIKALINKDVVAGTAALVKINEQFTNLVILTHLNSNREWVIMGSSYAGVVTSDMGIYKLVVEDQSGLHFSLAQKYWNGAKQLGQVDSDTEITFERKAPLFKTGPYSKFCTLCESHFEGHKSQKICASCCNDLQEAHLIIDTDLIKKNSKSVSFSEVRKIAKAAFELGRTTNEPFDSWFNEKY
jgi:hypothetical protein